MKEKKKILVVCQYFYPEQFRINDICVEMVKRGYDVTVVTGIPNYPMGDFFDGYGWTKKRKEEYKGVRIIRIPIIPRGHKTSTLILNYISYVVSGFFWNIFTRIRADKVFIFQLSPMTQALIGVWYARKRKIPCTIYVQDLWPDSVEAITGIHNSKIIRVIDKMVNYVYKNCDSILATSPSFVSNIENRISAWSTDGKSKVSYCPQYAEAFYVPASRQNISDLKKASIFRVVFTGNVGYAQGLDILPKVANVLMERNVECEFVIIGDGRYLDELKNDTVEKQVQSMFCFLGRKKPEDIPMYLANCDIAFISFAQNALYDMTIPAKLQSYMACKMPILAVAGGETKRIVEEAKCGICCGYNDIEQVVNSIIDLKNNPASLEEMGNNAFTYSCSFFDGERILDQLEKYMG